jgi:hypothetical protein
MVAASFFDFVPKDEIKKDIANSPTSSFSDEGTPKSLLDE